MAFSRMSQSHVSMNFFTFNFHLFLNISFIYLKYKFLYENSQKYIYFEIQSCLQNRTCKYYNQITHFSHLILFMTIYNKSSSILRDISSMEIVRFWHVQNRGNLVGMNTRLHISSMCIQSNEHVIANYGIKVRILVSFNQNYYFEIFYCFVTFD
jgi:hypothetical protein